MKVTALLRVRANSSTEGTIYFRLRDGDKDFRVASELVINPNHWDAHSQTYKNRVTTILEDTKRKFNADIVELKRKIEEEYTGTQGKEWLAKVIYNYHHPKRTRKHKSKQAITEPNSTSVITLFDKFLQMHPLSEVRRKNFRVVGRILARFELFIKLGYGPIQFSFLDINSVTPEVLQVLWNFTRDEHELVEKFPKLYEKIPEKRTPKPRGRNSLIDIFSRIRTFYIWCFDQQLTSNRPFDKFVVGEARYGTPYYITIEERNRIYNTNLGRHPQLAVQRDIFVFQCLIGCRVGDLLSLKKQNVINKAIEYVPRKTKDGRPLTVRVPLNPIAQEIIEKYQDCKGDALLPFISEQKYNYAIKRIFMAAGLNRLVTVIDPTTGNEEKRILYEVASSHIARRTFVGNLYKQVKDPNLVGALSGHKEGSKAFARYREIDEDMKKELIDLLS